MSDHVDFVRYWGTAPSVDPQVPQISLTNVLADDLESLEDLAPLGISQATNRPHLQVL